MTAAVREFTVHDCEQRSPEWLAARAGVLTASEASDMLAKPTTKGEAACRRDLRIRKALELLTGKPSEDSGFVSFDMKRGIEMEPEALAWYEAETGQLVRRVGFLRHNSEPIGCSPDGIIGDFDGGLELKNPKQATHWGYLQLRGAMPNDYLPQVLHSLLVTGSAWWDFASYRPDFPESARMYRVRVYRASVDLKAYDLAARLFWTEVEREVETMRALMAVEVSRMRFEAVWLDGSGVIANEDVRNDIRVEFRKLKGKHIDITIEVHSKQRRRTSEQNAFLHAEPFPKLAAKWGESVARAKLILYG